MKTKIFALHDDSNVQHLKAPAPIEQVQTQPQRKPNSKVYLALVTFISTVSMLIGLSTAKAQEIQEVTSPSGIKAWLVEDHTVPIISMDFSFAGGTAQDPEGKEGTVNMLTSLLDEGAGDMDAKAFQTAMERDAIKLSFDAGRDRFFGSLRILSPSKAVGFDLLAKAVQSPRFDAAPIERMRASWLSAVRRASTQPETIVSEAWGKAAYPDHPYSQPSRGTVKSLETISRDDLVAMHKAIFTRQDLTIGVVGAIDAKTLGKLLDQVFAPLPEKGELKVVKDVTLSKTGLVEVPFDVPQTTIRFGAQGIDRKDPDFFPAFLVNHILGGGSFSSRLYNEVREKRGLAYGVYSYLVDLDHMSLFGGGMSTRTDNTQQAIMLLKQEIARMAKDGPTEKELADAKKFLIGSYPLRFDSSSKISRQLVGVQNSDLGKDYFERRNSYIEAVTLEDAKRVAATLLDPNKLLMIVVGKQMKAAETAPTEAPVAANDNQTRQVAKGQ
nr:pitrilysin family protein [uncultured Cohaesibacter sp.]